MNEDLARRWNAALAAVHAGLMTCQEAADAYSIDRSGLRRRCLRYGFDPVEARKTRVRRLARKAYDQKWKLPHALQPAARTKKPRIVAKATPHKRTILAHLRSGALTIDKAAKLTAVPISGVIGWMKLARIPIPEPYATRRKSNAPKSDANSNT
jgi:hypothetical protein